MILENCRFVQFVMSRFRVKLVLSIFSLAVMMTVMSKILAVHCCTRTCMIPMNVTGVRMECRAVIFLSTMVLRWEFQYLRDDRPWKPSCVKSSIGHACQVS